MSLFEPFRPLGSRPASGSEDDSGSGLSGGTVRTRVSRCPKCFVSVRTLGTPAPSVCPYCGRALDRTEEEVPLAPKVDPPSQAEIAERLHRIYHRPPLAVVGLLAAAALFILAWAVYGQIHTLREWWYNALAVGLYSAVAGLFVITRFLFAAFYRAPPERGFEPTVSVLVPCFN